MSAATETSFVKITSEWAGGETCSSHSVSCCCFCRCALIFPVPHIPISLLLCVLQESSSSSEVAAAARSGAREAALYHGGQEVPSIPRSPRGRHFAANELVWELLPPPLRHVTPGLNILLIENSQRPQRRRRANGFFSRHHFTGDPR